MKRTKKQISARFFHGIPLLLSLLTPYLMVLAFFMQQSAIRRSLKERFEHTHMVKLELKDHQFQWLKKGKEIAVDGRMFDIKAMKKTGNTTLFYGIFDDEETALVNSWFNLQQKEKQNTFFHHTGVAFLIFGQSIQNPPFKIDPPVNNDPACYGRGYNLQIPAGFSSSLLRPPSPVSCV